MITQDPQWDQLRKVTLFMSIGLGEHLPKSAEEVTKATIEMLMPCKKHVHTITADNGQEFSGHREIAVALDTELYFAHPYYSCERGANENVYGLLRQYVKKGTDLRAVMADDLEFAQSRINNRPKNV